MTTTDVVVIGAGWAGLTAASRLASAGYDVLVLEKSRGPGGRSATRRDGSFSFDHGAQYFTARSEAFASRVESWLGAGLVGEWHPRIRVVGRRPHQVDSSPERRLVAVPGMNGLLHQFARGVACRYQVRVESVHFEDIWQVRLDDDSRVQARSLVLTAPPAQSGELLGTDHPFHERLGRTGMQPCWALMLGYENFPDIGFDAAFINEGELAWLARNSSKPQREGPETWVLHATPEWSREHLELDSEEIAERMLDSLCRVEPAFRACPDICLAHRWRYALADRPLGDGVLVDGESSLVLAGDWCAGNRIEGAWTSGVAASSQVRALL